MRLFITLMFIIRSMLAGHDPANLTWFGHSFKALGGFFSGGAGYVLSRATVDR